MAPFWRQGEEERDPELEAARADAEAALPDGWQLVGTDRESFSWLEPNVTVHGALASGPGSQHAVALALTEAEAYRQLARRLRDELEVSDGWAPPLR